MRKRRREREKRKKRGRPNHHRLPVGLLFRRRLVRRVRRPRGPKKKGGKKKRGSPGAALNEDPQHFGVCLSNRATYSLGKGERKKKKEGKGSPPPSLEPFVLFLEIPLYFGFRLGGKRKKKRVRCAERGSTISPRTFLRVQSRGGREKGEEEKKSAARHRQ